MRRQLWWVLGAVLVAAGVTIAVTARSTPADFGWFAYTPPSNGPDWFMGMSDSPTTGNASLWILSRWQVVGLVAALVGLLVVVSGAAYRLGRRRRPDAPRG